MTPLAMKRVEDIKRLSLVACTACVGCVLLASCIPWTIVPIDEESPGQETSDPRAYVGSIWNSKLIPTILASETDLESAQAKYTAGDGSHFLVKGEGRIIEADTSSRSGTLTLDIAPYDGQADASILIGPVILGSSLRDAAGFIEFSQFNNQLDYADVAIELNRLVVETVVPQIDLEHITGKTVSFHGAWTPGDTGKIEIVPVVLEVQ